MRSKKSLPITLKAISECLQFDFDRGTVHFKERPVWHFRSPQDAARINSRISGQPAKVTLSKEGYHLIVFFDRNVRVHRLIYAAYHGIEPSDLPKIIDHKDGNPGNNSVSNLRAADASQNSMNSRPRSAHSKGVCFFPKRWKWDACIQAYGKRHWLGYFDTELEAAAAYAEAARNIHGEFARV